MTARDSRGRNQQASRPAGGIATRTADGSATADPDMPAGVVPVAFYGRTARAAGTDDSRADRHRQLALCRAVAAACGGQVTAEFFDEACRADFPWHRRPQGRSLLAALSGRGRLAGAVAVADPWCLLPRRPVPSSGILARLAFRRVLLVLASPAIVISSAGEYAVLGRLLSGPACGAPPDGSIAGPSVRDHRSRGGRAAPGLSRHTGEPS